MVHVNEYFYYDSKFEIKKYFFSGTGAGSPKNPNLKRKKIFFGGRGVVWGKVGVGEGKEFFFGGGEGEGGGRG